MKKNNDNFRVGRWQWLAIATLCFTMATGACGDDGGAAGDFTILEEGEGPANAEPLFTLKGGSRYTIERNLGFGSSTADVITRGPYLMEGQDVYRVVVASQRNFQLTSEVFHVEDEKGVWLVGGTEDGLLPGGILTVPATVRKGMRWRSSPGGGFASYTFEVTERLVQPSGLGIETIFWQIGQVFEGDSEPSIYRYYAEGFGQVTVSDQPGPPTGPDRLSRSFPMDSDKPALEVPEFDLIEAAPQTIELAPVGGPLPEELRLDMLRGIRSADGLKTHLSAIGILVSGNAGIRGSGRPLTYLATGGSELGVISYAPFEGWTEPLLESRNPTEYQGRYDAVDLFGNAIYTAKGLFASTSDALLFENPAGGANAFEASYGRHSCPFATLSCEEVVVLPGLETFRGEVWGGSGLQGRVLQGQLDPSHLHYGILSLIGSQLWTARTRNIELGKVTETASFVDDLLEPVSTLTTVDGDVHYVVSASGFIERISFGSQGATRTILGRARVPVGQTLLAAVELGSGNLALVTHEPATETHFLWYGKPATPVAGRASRGVYVEALGQDARVCWADSDAELETAGWTLGGVPALGAVPLGNNCALVIRDLSARPLLSESERGAEDQPGWRIVEGPVPGAGRVKAFYTNGVDSGDLLSSTGPQLAWTKGGGFIQEINSNSANPWATRQWGPGGRYVGKAVFGPYSTQIPGYAGMAGEGIWFAGTQGTVLGDDGSVTGYNGYALSGPEPVFFPFKAAVGGGPATALRPLNSGGLLIQSANILEASEHLGHAILRPDGSFTELEQPLNATPMVERANGEVCGTRSESGTNFLYCATPAGVVREAAIPLEAGQLVAIGNLINVPARITPLFDDRLAVVRGTGDIRVVDFETLVTLPYSMPVGYENVFRIENPHAGADGRLYVALWLNNVDHVYGAFTADGFKLGSELFDLLPLYANQSEAAGYEVKVFGVDELMVYLLAGPTVVHIPRAIWDAANN